MSFPNLSALAVKERPVTLFFLVLSIFAGIYSFVALGRAEDPAFTVRIMMVSAQWPGATPEEIERQLADPLETRIQEVENVYHIESIIHPGRVDILIEFDDFTPSEKMPQLFYQVRKRMQDQAPLLPAGVLGPFANDDFADVYFSVLSLTAPGLPMRDLLGTLDGIRDRLGRVSGVQKVIVIGEPKQKVYLEFDSQKLVNLGLTPAQMFAAIEEDNRLLPAGRFETAGPRIYVRLDNDLTRLEQLANVPLRIGNQLIRLNDVASIREGYEEPRQYVVRSRGEEAVLLGLVMEKGENGLQLGERMAAFVSDEQARLPLGMTFKPLTNQAHAISAAVNLFQFKFLVAMLVVMAVSILAIGLRAGLVVGIAIPVTLGLTFLVMLAMDINLDRITLGALILALGLLVDDAIIAIEMMIVKMEEGWDRVRAASYAWSVTAAPMLFGTLVTVVGFVPIGFAKSGVGEYTGNIFWVLGISLSLSWLVAVTFTPYLGVKMLPQPAQHTGHSPYDTAGYERLRGWISRCVRHRGKVVLATVLALVLAVIGMATVVEKQFFPSSDRPEVMISIYMPQGTSIAVTDQTAQKVEAILHDMPEVSTLSTYLGGGAPRFFISILPEQPDPAFAKMVAVGHNKADRDTIIATLQQHIDDGEFPEARVRVSSLLYGPPVTWPVSFRVVGPDVQKLRETAKALREIMAADEAIRDAHLEWDERAPVLHVAMDTERLRLMGLTPAEVSRQLQFELEGGPITQLRKENRLVEVIAKGHSSSEARLAGLELRSFDGRKIPLAQVGEVTVRYEEPVLKRYNREPFIAVHADVVGVQPNDMTAAIWTASEALRASLPPGYRIDIGGSVEQSGKADASIQKLQPLMFALMLIFVMLQMRSFAGTFIVVATAPLGVIGAVLALLLFGQPFGFVALLGLIGLAGILMRNTLILTQQVADNLAADMLPVTAVIEAAVRRARPVVLTAIAAVFAFVPLTFDSFWGPLAYVLIGGIAVGTAITLFFVPALYALWYKLER
ncbi:multidrug efflux pump subunit AcrB [Paraperlucidibaca baekdonensis]|uniref:Multidrug efflux pump subunit AcrB n=1 Tax=Paraperlucidibaca baekdonensis TaxID=748120 RepID=A0A3E0H390_9GAMM|nr:efflux RND transporter permease subunit [Paraperlucidibaca baekdonensis]REH36978.1 multidrug efflux pump subunit AcrB [Paraperlucidibaca baekdonensis]